MFVALLLFPGWAELAENVEHLFHDGHLAHSALHHPGEAADHPLGSHDEAPCSPTDHHCQCCASIPSVAPPAVALTPEPLPAAEGAPVLSYVRRPISRALPVPVRPPVA